MAQIKPIILKTLKEATLTESAIKIPATKLPTADYLQLKELIERIGGKWKGAGKHQNGTPKGQFNFAFYDPRPLVKSILETGEMPPKNPMAYFPTPPAPVEDVVELLRKHSDDPDDYFNQPERKYLEPSAGGGAIAQAIRKYTPGATLHVVEYLDLNIARLKEQKFNVVHEGDFLNYHPEDRYTLIFMNPPFKGNMYIKHVMHAFELLKPYGRMWAIVPDKRGMTNPQTEKFYEFIKCNHGSIENEYDESTFKHLGVKIKTLLIELENRPKSEEKHEGFKNYNVFSAVVSIDNMGKIKGFPEGFRAKVWEIYNKADTQKLNQLDFSEIREKIKPLINAAKKAIWTEDGHFFCLPNDDFKAVVENYANPNGSTMYEWVAHHSAPQSIAKLYEEVTGEKIQSEAPEANKKEAIQTAITGMTASLYFVKEGKRAAIETAIAGMESALLFIK